MIDVMGFVDRRQNVYVEAHISDIHFGVMDPRVQYQILKEQFLDTIYKMNVLDIVSINGDLYDHKFMASSDAVMYASIFVNDLINICRMKHATLILINGTASHDADQLKLFVPYLKDPTVDIRVVINEVQFQYVKGKKILCIPELYGKGKEYYQYFLFKQGEYDSCYMHGTFMGAIHGKNTHNLDSDREPVFSIEDFGFCNGPVISGHVHVHNTYKQDFHYIGSPIRWQFGEEQDKGYIILLHKPQTRQYHIHFQPITSFRYDTVYLDNMLQDDPKRIIDYITYLKSQGVDYLRVKFTKNVEDKINILKNYYRTKSNITIETDFEQEQVRKEIQTLGDKYKEYDYLFDKNLSSNEILVRYMNQSEKTDYWTVDNLTQFLHDIEKL